MGEWKTQLSIRVSQEFRRDFEAFAAKERRNASSMGCILLEWAFEQLKVAGSVDRLLKYQLGKRRHLQVPLMLLGTGIAGFLLSALWGRITRPLTFDRDTSIFLAKMWFGIAGSFIALYFLLKYK